MIGTQKIPFKKIEELKDFPVYNEDKMVDEIFFGQYYIQQSKSYLADIERNGFFAQIDERVIETITLESNVKKSLILKSENSQIIALEIPSRHRRSLKSQISEKQKKNFKVNYKVFLQFSKDTIEGFYFKL